MFDFLRRNKKPEPIFEKLGIDVHNHMIPGVDDGSESTEMSIGCIKKLWECGFRKMYITPHFNYPRYLNDEDDIRRRYDELKVALKEAGVEMELIGIGGEYQIDDAFPKRMENPRFLTIGNNECLLVETSLRHFRLDFEPTIEKLRMEGREVILAHPERYLYLSIKAHQFEKLKEEGVLFQCNIPSLAGFYGHEAQTRALEFIERGWVELLGTDMHNYAYADAIAACTHDRTVRKVIDKYQFMNSEMAGANHKRL